MRSILRNNLYVLFFLGIIFTILLGLFYVLTLSPIKAEKESLRLATRDQTRATIVDRGNYYEISAVDPFKPTQSQNYTSGGIGIIYYPGARIEPRAYLFKLKSIVLINRKITIFVTKPYFNFAFLSINAADQVIKENPEIKTWYVGGHSLGGAMACEYASKTQKELKGVILVASYCASDVSKKNLSILTVVGTNDGLVTAEKLKKYEKNLPSNAISYKIAGATHAQMGNYGKQSGDGEAKMSDEQVNFEITTAVDNFIK